MTVKVRKRIEKEQDFPDLPEKIRQARAQSDLTVTGLAKAAGISRKYWYQIENDKLECALSYDTLCRIESALGVNLDVSFEE